MASTNSEKSLLNSSSDQNLPDQSLSDQSLSDQSLPDHSLIERCRLGDQLAFETLFTKYQQRIIRLLNQQIQNFNDSHDLSQEVFMRAFESIKQFRGESSFYTWLYRIAVNMAKNHVMSKKRDVCVPMALEQAELIHARQNAQEDSESPEGMLIYLEAQHQLGNILGNLSEDLRTVVSLREHEGKSYQEIADIMNCPVGTVRSRLFRARAAIEKRLQ